MKNFMVKTRRTKGKVNQLVLIGSDDRKREKLSNRNLYSTHKPRKLGLIEAL